MSIKTLDAKEFRRTLAGLSDQSDGDDMNNDDYRELASQVGLLLYVAFNHRKLDSKSIHNRVQSAIGKGLADCDSQDVSQFISSALEHVSADINTVTNQEDCVQIQRAMYSLTGPQQLNLLRYIAKHKMPTQAWGCERWRDRKEEIAAQKAMLEIEEAKKEEVAV